MADLVFFTGPIDQSENEWLGLGAFFPSISQGVILSSANNYLTADPVSLSTIEYIGAFNYSTPDTLNGSPVTRIILRDSNDNVLVEITGLDLTFGEVDLSAVGLGDVIGDGSEVYGTSAADTLGGAAGDQIWNGGDGLDEAQFGGSSSDYSIGLLGGAITVTDNVPGINGDDGSDLLFNVETIVFSDVSLDVQLSFPEFNLAPSNPSGTLPFSDLASLPGSGFVIAYSDGFSGPGYLQRFDSSGVEVGSAIEYSAQPIGSFVASNAAGGMVIVRSEYPDGLSSTNVFATIYNPDGTPLASDIQVNLGTPNNQGANDVVFLEDGRFVVTWTTTIGTYDYDIYARVFEADGTSASLDFRVNDNTTNFQQVSSVTALPGGGFAVVWSSGWVPFYTSLKIYDSDLNGGSEITANTSSTATSGSTFISTTADGDILVTWVSGSPKGVYGRLLDATGTPVGDEFLVKAIASDVSPPTVTRSAVDANGNILITWLEHDNEVHGQWYDASLGEIGGIFLVSSSQNAGGPQLAPLSDGSILAAWSAPDADNQILGQKLAAGDEGLSGLEIRGTAAADSINGGEGTQLIFGLDGADSLLGGAGSDYIEGGAGGDFLSGDNDQQMSETGSRSDDVASSDPIKAGLDDISAIQPEFTYPTDIFDFL